MSREDWSGLPDVDFDFGAARSLQSAASNAATSVQDSVTSINRTSTTALKDFKGYFADVFRGNIATAKVDGQNIVVCLQALAKYCGELITAAEDENRRRSHARAWLEERKTITLGLRGDTAQPPIPDEPMPYQLDETGPSYSVQDLILKTRAAPVRGSGGSGTSSANPGNLRTFSTQAQLFGLAPGLSEFGGGKSLPSAWSDFLAGCRWGRLTDGGVCAAVGKWFSANVEAGEWIRVVASAFEAAGGSSDKVSSVSDTALEAALKSAGVSEVRLGIEVSPPTLQGVLPTTGYSNDPVNTATGNFIEPETDLHFEGVGSLLGVTRMYNSMDEHVGGFGLGWSSPFDARLDLTDEATTFIMADGRHLVFPSRHSEVCRAEHANFWLAEEPAALFPQVASVTESLLVARDNQGSWWAFTLSGEWLAQGAGSGTTVEVRRDEHGRVVALHHEFGREIRVSYSDGRVDAIRASDGRSAEYGYDSDRRLISVKTAAGTRRYRWNDEGLIDQVTAATGVIECENTYDAQRRVVTQITEFGRAVRFAYLPGRVTAVSDEDGTNSNTWISDRKGRLIGVVDTDERRQSMSYDAHGNLVSVTERDGQVTVHAYDERGRRVRTVTPEGADTRYEWDEFDRLVRVVEAVFGADATRESAAETRFEYAQDADRRPFRVIDPQGGITELQWDGSLLLATTDPTGVSTRFEYDGYGDLVSVTDALGNRTSLIRDHEGRVTQTLTPLGGRTEYSYDAAGNMTERREPDGAVWRFEYGPGGKIVAQTDPCGAQTRYEYGVHGEVARVVDPLGRVTEHEFDAFGNMRQVTLPDGANWLLRHDGLSRLREVIDPDGGSWRQDYDPVGEVAAFTDPTGVSVTAQRSRENRTERFRSAFTETVLEQDAFGRPVRSRRQDGSSEVNVYDLCGRVVEELDAEGGLTRYDRDAAGRVTRTVSPAGRETLFEYDECGRPKAMIDGLGSRTELVYDADSRVVEQRLATGDTATREYDPAGRVLLERVPGRGVARYGYDQVGRLTFSQDTRYGLRRFTYDGAGQLIKTVNGLGGVTRYEYDLQGRVTTIIDPVGGVTAREYTGLNKVRKVVDPLGRTTVASYDAAGKQLSQATPDSDTLSWEYDREGKACAYASSAGLIAEVDTDYVAGIETVEDHTAGSPAAVRHRVVRDRLGRVVARGRDGGVARWEYDGDGLRTLMVAPGGDTVSYVHDAAGRVSRIEHSAFGLIEYDYDGAGNLTSAKAGDTTQSWWYENGYPVVYTLTDGAGVSSTSIQRDDDGRIVSVEGPDGVVRYEHDDACQLTAAMTPTGTRRWEYDPAGRLTHETSNGEMVDYRYDAAGQLLERVTASGVVRYEYDRAGRRVREHGSQGERSYEWDPRGFLTRITDNGAEHTLWVDALGELAEAGGQTLFWDSAALFPTVTRLGDDPVFSAPGGITGVNDAWMPAGWRPARPTDSTDPWTASGAGPKGMPDGSISSDALSATGSGSLRLASLEWMGARSYDPVTRGFLTIDPLQPVVGAAWAGNPYSYAGNDPLHALDPHGLSPLTDTDITATGKGFDLNDWGWISTVLTVLGAPGTIYGKAVTTAKHAPTWLKSLVKFSRFVPWVGIPATAFLWMNALVTGNVADQWQYGVSLVLDAVGIFIWPVAVVGLLWDIGWVVVPAVTDWWNNSMVPWWNKAKQDLSREWANWQDPLYWVNKYSQGTLM